MIAKRIRRAKSEGSSHSALTYYILDRKNEGKKVRASWQVNCSSDNLDVAIKEVKVTQAMNTRSSSDKTYHLVFSLKEGEDLDDETLKAIEKELCASIGFEEHQRVSAVHSDTKNLHVHVAINKVHPITLNNVEPYYDKKRLQKACQNIEKKYGLSPELGRSEQKKDKAKSNFTERDSFINWLKKNVVADLKKILKTEGVNWQQIHELTAKSNVVIRPRGAGYVFSHKHIKLFVKASDVDRFFTKKRLDEILGPYERPSKANRHTKTRSGQKWEEYSQDKAIRKLAKDRELKAIRGDRDQKLAAINLEIKERLEKIRLDPSLGMVQKKALRSRLKAEKISRSQKIRSEANDSMGKIRDSLGYVSWIDWLKQKSLEGDEACLAILRSKGVDPIPSHENHIEGRVIIKEHLVWQVYEHSVNRSGSVSYKVGGEGVVIDEGLRIKVSSGAGKVAIEAALDLACEKFGPKLELNGSDTFKRLCREIVAKDKKYRRLQIVRAKPELSR